MTRSYVEHITAEYFRKKGYIVETNINYKAPSSSGWHDIDVLAIGIDDVLVIECKAYFGKNNYAEEVRDVEEKADWIVANKLPEYNHIIGEKRIRKLYVTDAKGTPGLSTTFATSEVEFISLKDILSNLIQMLKDQMSPDKVIIGKEDDYVIRTLISLIYNDLLK